MESDESELLNHIYCHGSKISVIQELQNNYRPHQSSNKSPKFLGIFGYQGRLADINDQEFTSGRYGILNFFSSRFPASAETTTKDTETVSFFRSGLSDLYGAKCPILEKSCAFTGLEF